MLRGAVICTSAFSNLQLMQVTAQAVNFYVFNRFWYDAVTCTIPKRVSCFTTTFNKIVGVYVSYTPVNFPTYFGRSRYVTHLKYIPCKKQG